MKSTIIIILLLISSLHFAQEQRKVLVEVFTNSHCPLCPPAHDAIKNYLIGSNGDKISYIFYHMVYPYEDDSLYHQSMASSDARNNYYNPVAATPQGWFDGIHQGSWSGWAASLDNLVNIPSPLKIILSGTRNSTQFNLNAQLTRTGDISENDLVIHFVVVEDLYYDGRNTVSDHKHVMRKMFPSPSGKSFSINLNETIDIPQTIGLEGIWDDDSLSVVVFVQSSGSKIVYQSETISYDELSVSSINNEVISPFDFILKQNYPNPFNPSTKIRFAVPQDARGETKNVSLKIYNVLGNEVATLVNEELSAGEYEIDFTASALVSGTYFYTLTSGNFRETKKMILLK